MFESPLQQLSVTSGPLITVRPIRPVWVDLAVAFPLPRGLLLRAMPDALDLQSRVAGELLLWGRTTTGHWVGYCRFRIPAGHSAMNAAQWLSARAIAPREDAPARRE